jgi:cytochrome P450
MNGPMSERPAQSVRGFDVTTPPRPVPVAHGYPLVGALPGILRDPLHALSRIGHENHGAVVAVPFGPMRTYLVSHPDHVEYVLQRNWRNFPKGTAMWKAVRRLIGNGLVTTDGELWQRQRRLLQPLFNPRRIAMHAEAMIATIESTLDELAPRAARGPVEMTSELALVSRRVILETIFGSNITRNESEELGQALIAAFEQVNVRMFLYFLPDRFPLPGDATLRRSILVVDEIMRGLIRRWKPKVDAGNDVLSLLIEAGRSDPAAAMDELQLRDEIVTLFVAGHMTTSTAMSWLFHLLDRHPDAAARIRAEVAEATGGEPLAPEHLERMPFGKMAIQEALRLYPPAWLFFRTNAEDDRIGGYTVPAGSNLILSPWITQRDPALWEAPDAFVPERFSPERAAKQHRYAYFPFGAGPRVCIGNAFSLMEAQITMALALRRWRMQLVPGHRVTPKSMTGLVPRDGLPMYLRPA